MHTEESQAIRRCHWLNLNNPVYVAYHDHEWGRLNLDEHYLFEMLLLECFQAGLSWECVLMKREAFREAYDGFDVNKVANYDEIKINELLSDARLVRHRLKIEASIGNARVFLAIETEFGSFAKYLQTFAHHRVFCETGLTRSPLSDALSKDLKKRGMRFVGSVTIYSYLQAIGIVNSHDPCCFLSPRS